MLTHESDLSPGLSTKLSAKKCVRVLTSFPETAKLFENGEYVGSPIRREILNGERSRARRKFSLSESKPVLLILGGGSGSKAINEAVRSCLKPLLARFDILHLCGKGNLMKDAPKGYVQLEFESDMGSAYAACDLVWARGDQLENAAYFEKKGLCRLLRESELDALYPVLCATLQDDALKQRLAESSFTSGTQSILSFIAKYA